MILFPPGNTGSGVNSCHCETAAEEECTYCANQEADSSFEITFGFFTSGTCPTGDYCPDLIDTFVVDWFGEAVNECYWTYDFDPWLECWDPLALPFGVNYCIEKLQFQVRYDNPDYYFEVGFIERNTANQGQCSGAGTWRMIFQKDMGTSAPDCTGLTNVDIPFIGNDVNITCDFSTVSCTLSSA